MVIKDVIKDVEAFFVKVPTKVKYKMSKGGSRRSYMAAIIRITTDTGLTGYGEVFGTPGWYSAESPDGLLMMINRWFRPILIKERICDIERIIHKLDEERMGNNFAKSGVDMALYDLMGKLIIRRNDLKRAFGIIFYPFSWRIKFFGRRFKFIGRNMVVNHFN